MSADTTLAGRVQELEIQLAWQGELLESLNQTVAALNRETAGQTRRILALQEELQRQRNQPGIPHEKPPHY